MSYASSSMRITRARPLLGTRAAICVTGLAQAEAHRAVDLGFAAIARVHRLMSFHNPDSDVSRLNREAYLRPVHVAAATFEVLRRSLEISLAVHGLFDITTARQLVSWGFLPLPASPLPPDARASWRDIELLNDHRVRFHRPLWVDLGGIAKGYAVDHALKCMALELDTQCCINAGGDLRVCGPDTESVLLRAAPTAGMVPIVKLHNGSLASSSGREAGRVYRRRRIGPHVHGVRRHTIGLRSFVSVIANECVVADALTKVVMARGPNLDGLLRRFGATAYLQNARDGWRTAGTGT